MFILQAENTLCYGVLRQSNEWKVDTRRHLVVWRTLMVETGSGHKKSIPAAMDDRV